MSNYEILRKVKSKVTSVWSEERAIEILRKSGIEEPSQELIDATRREIRRRFFEAINKLQDQEKTNEVV